MVVMGTNEGGGVGPNKVGKMGGRRGQSETVLNRPRRWVEGRSHGSEAKL